LQEAVDALIDNGRRGRPVTGPGNRPLKSLSDMLKGKQGRFRQNLLGKRVDYSGRSVIVVGPELKMHQCGLPKEMALELFKPFVMKRLVNGGQAHNIKSAKRMVEKARSEVWDVLEDVIKEHPVLLNRAPTLHRLGIQAFEPVLSEGRAIKIHPLVCTAYNADFDGDQMAVHVPLSVESQAEARILMLSSHNILAPKDGKPVAVPTQDMVLGSYYLTIRKEGAKGAGSFYSSVNEALLAHFNSLVDIHAPVKIRFANSYINDQLPEKDCTIVETTVGNAIFNEALPRDMRYFYQDGGQWHLEKLIDKKELGRLVAKAHKLYGNTQTARILDDIKSMGYHNACVAGITIAVSDIKVPERKKEILDEAEHEVDRTELAFRRGLLSEEERYRKVIKLWGDATEEVTKELMASTLDAFNPIYMMANSGARGNIQQIRQLAGMRGLMADPSGRIIDWPIKANFREGLTVLEYFISTHGARKGLADTALRTADSGYLTRRLVDVAQDVIVREDDCDVFAVNLNKERQNVRRAVTGHSVRKLEEILTGRYLAGDVTDANSGQILAQTDTIIDGKLFNLFNDSAVYELFLRPVYEGDPEETIIFNLSATEAENAVIANLSHEVLGYGAFEDITDDNGLLLAEKGQELTGELLREIVKNRVREFKVKRNEIEGIEVEAITEGKDDRAVIEPLRDRIVGRTLAEDIKDPHTGEVLYPINEMITEDAADEIIKLKKTVFIRSVLNCRAKYGVCRKCYGKNLATGALVDVGEAVGIIAAQSIGEPGTQLTMRTFHTGGVAGDDITLGLPRVEELFEARKPKRPGVISEHAGKVALGENKGVRKVIITTESKEEIPYNIPYGAKINVSEGQEVNVGARLTEGSLNPHDILRISGVRATQRYLAREVQKVYKSQGVEINDRHIEVMIRQMMRKVRVEETGDTTMLPGEYIDANEFKENNRKAMEERLAPAEGKPVLLGITKASLATDSFLSAASFQETTRVLTDAAIKGKIDPLLGLKENVIIGKLVPAGTGMSRYRNIKIKRTD
ncbi:MAG: DNA-directed RNA polymerase subunit beta', partial [Acidaminococcales bacterium]|nr:DNA-directed RNA polymerase subunit beta' [Acidaminococcales bacterium]